MAAAMSQGIAAVRYVDATDFGAHAVEWVLLVQGQGHVVLTVEGLPVARVEPLAGATELAVRQTEHIRDQQDS